jgi:hypothetical protein
LKRRAGVELTKITGLIPISNWNKGEKNGDWEVLIFLAGVMVPLRACNAFRGSARSFGYRFMSGVPAFKMMMVCT